MPNLDIVIAGHAFSIPPLTLRQLRDLSVGVFKPIPIDPAAAIADGYDRDVEVLVSAIRAVDPSITADTIFGWHFEKKADFANIVKAVLDHSGLLSGRPPLEILRAQRDKLDIQIAEAEAEEAKEMAANGGKDQPAAT